MKSSIMNTLQYGENEEFKNTWPSTFNNTFLHYENESTNDTFGTNCIIDIFYHERSRVNIKNVTIQIF